MITVKIERIAAGGDGVGRVDDGRVVFVPRTTPGDVAVVEKSADRPRFIKARLQRIEEPGDSRVEPECPHYTRDACGGCQLQHVSATAQLDAKSRIVGDALRRIGKLDLADPVVEASADPWRYRRKITLAVRDVQRGRVIGLRDHADPNRVFSLEDCLITSDGLMALWRAVSANASLLPKSLESLVLMEDREEASHVVATSGRAEAAPWNATKLATAVGDPTVTFWWQPARGAARVVWGSRRGYPGLAFQQGNPAMAQQIRLNAVGALGDLEGVVVWDLYGGAGDTAALLAERGAQVWSVDSDRSAKRWAARAPQPGVHHVTDRVEQVLRRLPEPAAIVLNPPRSGLARAVAVWLEGWGKRVGGALVYISCDPATLARDLQRMPSLRVDSVSGYDLFPQTSHVETLVVAQGGP